MPKVHVLLGCTASLLLLSCAHSYGLDRQMQSGLLPPSATLYVTLPRPGRYDDTLYEMSGRQTGEAIVRAFAPQVARVILGSRTESAEDARISAHAQNASHLVYPTIMHWEDRATEWSGVPDRVRVQIRIYDVTSGKLLDSAEVSGKSRWATFGGDHPQELLDRAVGDYVDLLFEGTIHQ